jgi:hypothetical protein
MNEAERPLQSKIWEHLLDPVEAQLELVRRDIGRKCKRLTCYSFYFSVVTNR